MIDTSKAEQASLPVETVIRQPEEVGRFIRQRRKSLGLTQVGLAGLSGVSHKFLIEVERGKPTTQLGKVMHLLAMLGVDLVARPR